MLSRSTAISDLIVTRAVSAVAELIFSIQSSNLCEYLRWDEHIQQITSKVAINVGIVNKVKSLITSKLLLTLYNSLSCHT